MAYCCENCFAHSWLKQRVREMSTRRGVCDYCRDDSYEDEDPEDKGYEAHESALVDVDELSEYFHRLISMYTIPEFDVWDLGEPLIWRVQWDWGVFDEDCLSEDRQVELLQDIVNSDWDDDDGESPIDAHDLYMRGTIYHTSHAETWSEFVSEVRKNPDAEIPFYEYLEDSLKSIDIPAAGQIYYRARLGCEVDENDEYEPYRATAIGAPSADKVERPGRANYAGESFLYCAEEEGTAVAEMRPPRGYLVSVCSLTLDRNAHILDLRGPVAQANPFVTDTPLWEYEIDELLGEFAEEMSRPLERDNDEQRHYLPAQKLAHFIKDVGFDGIRYPSALSDNGTNVVFFDPLIATIGESKLVRITKTVVEYELEETAGERHQRMMDQFKRKESSER